MQALAIQWKKTGEKADEKHATEGIFTKSACGIRL